jgi:hypothetical protein
LIHRHSEAVVNDLTLIQQVDELIAEEHALRESSDPAASERLAGIDQELDRCWDLLRQRRALREFGEDPDLGQARPISEVESYEQ